MRTTVTIDPDTEHLLREQARHTGQSFKEVLNGAIRRALSEPSGEYLKVEPIFPAAFPVELEEQSMNRLVDAWDDEATIEELAR